jgi:hypothetical protein
MSGIIDTVGSKSGIVGSDVYPAGHVLQVVVVTNTTSTVITAATNFMSATITPSSTSNNILFTMTLTGVAQRLAGISEGFTRFMRGSTQIAVLDGITPWNGNSTSSLSYGSICGSWYDSPSSTSALTYHCNVSGTANGFNVNNEGGCSSIILMEIKV